MSICILLGGDKFQEVKSKVYKEGLVGEGELSKKECLIRWHLVFQLSLYVSKGERWVCHMTSIADSGTACVKDLAYGHAGIAGRQGGWNTEKTKRVISFYLFHCRRQGLCLLIFQFSSVTQSSPALCDPMDCRTPGFLVHHQFLELTQTYVHQVSDAVQPSHPLSSPSPAFNLSSIRVFSNESALRIRWPKYQSFSISPSNEYSGFISFRID